MTINIMYLPVMYKNVSVTGSQNEVALMLYLLQIQRKIDLFDLFLPMTQNNP